MSYCVICNTLIKRTTPSIQCTGECEGLFHHSCVIAKYNLDPSSSAFPTFRCETCMMHRSTTMIRTPQTSPSNSDPRSPTKVHRLSDIIDRQDTIEVTTNVKIDELASALTKSITNSITSLLSANLVSIQASVAEVNTTVSAMRGDIATLSTLHQSLSTRVDHIEATSQAAVSDIEILKSDMKLFSTKLDNIAEQTGTACPSNSLPTSELVVSGIPSDLELNNSEIVAKLFST